jgi:hypothetical protein
MIIKNNIYNIIYIIQYIMQFNYQNIKTEEENLEDLRNYGLLNRSIIDDEFQHNEIDTVKILNNEIELLKNRNKVVEELCQNLRNNMRTILENSASLENELNNTKKKLVETEFALKKLMKKMNYNM